MEQSGFILGCQEQVFRLKRSARNPILWVIGGGVAVTFALVGFVLALFTRHDPVSLQLTTTLPLLAGIQAFGIAWTTWNTPEEIRLSPAGLCLVRSRGSQFYPWEQVGWVHVEPTPMGTRRALRIYNPQGGTLARLGDGIEEFELLHDWLNWYIAQRADGTAERLQRTKARRSAGVMIGGGVAFLALSAAVAWLSHQEMRAERLLRTAAVEGTAQVVRRFTAPNGRTRRLVYRVTTPDGHPGEQNVEVEPDAWARLENATTVPVRYVPAQPEISELVSGQVRQRDPFKQPLVGYGLPAVLALMSVGFIAVGVLQWRGLDLDLDSKTGKLSIKPFGTGR